MKWSDNGGGDFEQLEAGSHIARCIKVIDLGTQKGEYQGKPTSKRQSLLTWEIPSEVISEGEYAGQPFTINKFYTSSLGEKANLRKDLESWRGRAFTQEELDGFDPRKIIGTPCMLSVIHTDKGRAKVANVMALPKGMTCPAQISESLFFSLEPDEYREVALGFLTEGIKKIVMNSPEFVALFGDSPKEESGW